jgi:hypothetical protein
MPSRIRDLFHCSRAACVVALGCALVGVPLHGQGVNLQVVPKIGVFTALGTFGENSELESSLAYGVAGEVTLPALPVNLRINLDHASATNIVRRDATEAVLGTASITAVVGQLVFRPLAPAALFQPYFLAGGGVKRYDFTREAGAPELVGIGHSATRGTVHIGGGVDVRFGPLALLLEVGNYMSTLAADAGESRLQHDAFGMLGFRVSMF